VGHRASLDPADKRQKFCVYRKSNTFAQSSPITLQTTLSQAPRIQNGGAKI